MMVPVAVTMLPNFVAMKFLPEVLDRALPWINWSAQRVLGTTLADPNAGRLVGIDSYFALIVPVMFSAYGTFMLRQFFLSIPRDIDEAAEIDGASHATIFWRMILPLALPGLATLTVFTFLGVWGSFLWPLIVTNETQLATLPLGLLGFQNSYNYGTEWHLMMAASLLILLPRRRALPHRPTLLRLRPHDRRRQRLNARPPLRPSVTYYVTLKIRL